MISRFALTVCLLVCCVTAGLSQQDPGVVAREELNQGVAAFRGAHYEEAAEHFNNALNLEPDLIIARLFLATTYSQLFVPGVDTPDNVVWATKAMDQYSEILNSNPSDIDSMKGLAYLQFQLKNFSQAKESYKKAIALDPSDPELFYAAAVADWSIADREIAAEKAKVDAESEYSLIESEGCADARAKSLAGIDSGLAMLTKAISLRKDYDDAMTYMNLLYRLRAELQCGNKKAYKADLHQADEWSARAAAARKKKADAAANGEQEKAPEKPRM
jgi:tetratricopeptide (TPR) repeat protein